MISLPAPATPIRITRCLPFVAFLLLTPMMASAQGVWELATRYAEEAVRRNPDLATSKLDVSLAEQNKREAFGALLPTLEFRSRYSRSDGGRVISIDPNDMFPATILPVNVPPTEIPFLRAKDQETYLRLQRSGFDAGAKRNKLSAAKAQLEAEQNHWRARAGRLGTDVRIAYLTCLQAHEQVEVAERQLEAVREQEISVQRRVDAGSANRAEALRVHAEAGCAEVTLVQAREDETIALASFNRYLDVPLESPIQFPVEVVPLPPEENEDVDSMTQTALEKRWELRSLKQTEKAAGYVVKVSKSSCFPNLFLQADYGFQGETFDFGHDNDYYTVTTALQFSLFDGIGRSARYQRSVIEQRQAHEQLRYAQRGVEQEVLIARARLSSKREVYTSALAAVEAAREGYRATLRLFEEGSAPLVQVMDANATLCESEAFEVTARYDVWKSQAELVRTLGWIPQTAQHEEF